MSPSKPETLSVPTPSGALDVHCWSPAEAALTVVTVHPWATLGGGEHNCIGTARELASTCGVRVLTFDMRASWMVWGVVSAHRKEVGQIKAVCEWAKERWGGRLVLLGSSAGAPFAGSAIVAVPSVEGLIAIGYTWGFPASVAFGRHFGAVQQCDKPKLFIQGEHDEFTGVSTLQAKMAHAAGDNEVVVVPGVGHFELESPAYDDHVAELSAAWLRTKGLLV